MAINAVLERTEIKSHSIDGDQQSKIIRCSIDGDQRSFRTDGDEEPFDRWRPTIENYTLIDRWRSTQFSNGRRLKSHSIDGDQQSKNIRCSIDGDQCSSRTDGDKEPFDRWRPTIKDYTLFDRWRSTQFPNGRR